jgi:hypothetical protein
MLGQVDGDAGGCRDIVGCGMDASIGIAREGLRQVMRRQQVMT